jgi:hypothetical protein
MKQTLIYETTTVGECLTYANGEWAWISGDYIASSPKNSTAIGFWKYEVGTKLLVVRYKNAETFYTYEGVPFPTMFALMSADSLGAFIAREIKPNFSVAP